MSGVSLLKMDGMGGRRGNGYAASWLLDVQHGLCFFEPSLPFPSCSAAEEDGCAARSLHQSVFMNLPLFSAANISLSPNHMMK